MLSAVQAVAGISEKRLGLGLPGTSRETLRLLQELCGVLGVLEETAARTAGIGLNDGLVNESSRLLDNGDFSTFVAEPAEEDQH